MLKLIRDEQLAALADAMEEELRLWMVKHLREHFAPFTEGKDQAALEDFVRRGLRRARELSVESSSALCTFVDLTVVLGEKFDTGPDHPWAVRTMQDKSIRDADSRVAMVARMAAEQ